MHHVSRHLMPLDTCLLHLVGSLDDLGVHLVGALRRYQLGDLAHRIDVRFLEIALMDRAEAGIAGDAVDRRARGGGLAIEVVAERLQAGVVGEVDQRQLAEQLRRRRARRLA